MPPPSSIFSPVFPLLIEHVLLYKTHPRYLHRGKYVNVNSNSSGITINATQIKTCCPFLLFAHLTKLNGLFSLLFFLTTSAIVTLPCFSLLLSYFSLFLAYTFFTAKSIDSCSFLCFSTLSTTFSLCFYTIFIINFSLFLFSFNLSLYFSLFFKSCFLTYLTKS